MNRALAIGLTRLEAAGGRANLADLGLTRNQIDNFQKLRYWDLVLQVSVDGVRKRGVWEVTPKGAEFLRGDLRVPRAVFTYRGERTQFDGPLVAIESLVESRARRVRSYRKREDYNRDLRLPGDQMEAFG
jgi:hypothetical protein